MKTKFFIGIETSCDDTSIAILKEDSNFDIELLSHISFDQSKSLEKWGGVVPEIAARNHLEKLTPTLQLALKQAAIKIEDINCIGVTAFPGLIGPLLTGINAAKSLSLFYQKPILPVNHLFAHLEAIHLTEKIKYPYLGVLISGGHTLFALVKDVDNFSILASTLDDAAGEAFDKAGKLLNLGYPAGPIIDRLAQKGLPSYEFPIGLKNSGDANMSFSGLKTSLRNFLDKNKDYHLENLCHSYQMTIANTLSFKFKFIRDKYPELPIVVGGGVACNTSIRKVFNKTYQNVHFVQPQFCTDNGAMIANYTRLNYKNALPFPASLEIDASSRFIDKKDFR